MTNLSGVVIALFHMKLIHVVLRKSFCKGGVAQICLLQLKELNLCMTLCFFRAHCMPPLVPGDPTLSRLDTAYTALCNLETSKF